jgi:tRNA (guanine9-N1)-methyltransferase
MDSELPKDQLVYLTADSETLIQDLSPGSIYLIGGIVDHNRHKLLTFNKAQKEGLKTGRLPIRESGVQLTSSAVLTVNHVFDIIARYLEQKGDDA